jgi:hypothetical protein
VAPSVPRPRLGLSSSRPRLRAVPICARWWGGGGVDDWTEEEEEVKRDATE